MGSEAALEDLDAWLQEFDRVVDHVSSGRGIIAQDRIGNLLACWPKETNIGENLRMDQRQHDYLEAEQRGDYELCWKMLLDTLPGCTGCIPAEGPVSVEGSRLAGGR